MKPSRKDLTQMRCPDCRIVYPFKFCRRIMNFTSGEITFYCRSCRKKLAFITFSQWNQLHHALSSPSHPEKEKKPSSRRRFGRRR